MSSARLRTTADLLKPRPHVVRRKLSDGQFRYYCYAFRSGELLFTRDGQKPTRDEAVAAAAIAMHPPVVVANGPREVVKPGRGKGFHRPLFIQDLIKTYENSDRWTYFIGSRGGAVKIGAAKCVRGRLKILQAHNSEPLEVLAMVRGGEVLESAYHALFARHRMNNEWFNPAPEVLAEIDYLGKLSWVRARKTRPATMEE